MSGFVSRRAFLKASVAAVSAAPLLTDEGSAQVTETCPVPAFSGVDCHDYPGDDAVKQLREELKYQIIGFYLKHGPGANDQTWTPARRTALAMGGWGFFPIYNGADLKDMMLKPSLGKRHGLEAAKFMHASGFAEGSIVYLDIEKPADRGQLSPYIQNWMEVVKGNKFYPGHYGSYAMASWLKDLSSAVWTVELPRDATITSYDPGQNPEGVIRSGCVATQYLHRHTFPTVKGNPGGDGTYDLSRSLAADPSDAACVAAALKIQKLK